jgi:hypothetical protein
MTLYQTADGAAATVALPVINQLLQLGRHPTNERLPFVWAAAVASSPESSIAYLCPQSPARAEDIELYTRISRLRLAGIDRVANHGGASLNHRMQQVSTSVSGRKVQVNLINSDLNQDREALLCAASIVPTAHSSTGFESMNLTRACSKQLVRS